jgi:hypothetical protein
MAKNFRMTDFPHTLFDMAASAEEEGGFRFTIGATGPRRQCSVWQEKFEDWANRYKYKYEAEPDTGQKGIRRREVSVVVNTALLLEFILHDINGFIYITLDLERQLSKVEGKTKSESDGNFVRIKSTSS